MKTAVMRLPYLPSVSWWSDFVAHDMVYIESCENFVKATDRNRCSINGANGALLLSIPVEGGREKRQLYRDVKIYCQSDWQKQHWQSILSAYGSAPFFDHYAALLQPFYERKYDRLFDFNLTILERIHSWLKLEKKLALTESYIKHPDVITDLRTTKDQVRNYPRYYQVFEERHGFSPNLSIIDLLFHLGPEAKDYLLNLSK